MVLTICLLISLEPTVDFGNQRNPRISRLFASRLLTNLLVARAMHDFQEQCQNVRKCVPYNAVFVLFSSNNAPPALP